MKRHSTGATGASTVYERISYEQREQLKAFITEHRKFSKAGTVFKVMPPRKSEKVKEEDNSKPKAGAYRYRENHAVRKHRRRRTMKDMLVKHQEFAEFVALLMFDPSYEENIESTREHILRKLNKLGYVERCGNEWQYFEVDKGDEVV